MEICEELHDFERPSSWLSELPVEEEELGPPKSQGATPELAAVQLIEALTQHVVSKLERAARLETIEKELLLLKRRVNALETGHALILPVESLEPEPYDVIKPFHVVVHAQDDSYIATFFDANLSASGDTQEESVMNLKDLIVAVYETLASHGQDLLGPGPLRQFQVLKAVIVPR